MVNRDTQLTRLFLFTIGAFHYYHLLLILYGLLELVFSVLNASFNIPIVFLQKNTKLFRYFKGLQMYFGIALGDNLNACVYMSLITRGDASYASDLMVLAPV